MQEANLRTYLLGDASIAALVAARVYPDYMPQPATLPAIVYQRITTANGELLDGTVDLKDALFQITAWATTRQGASALGALIASRMLGISSVSTDGFQKGGVEDERADYEADTKFYRHDVDCKLFYSES